MNIRNAFVRATRTFAQTLAAGLATLAVVNLTDIKMVGDRVAVLFVASLLAGAISFLQNLAEENSSLNLPRG